MSVANGDFDSGFSRYQVYRGLSPDTSNRLEVKVQSLEEELQAERQARLAAQEQYTYLVEELNLQSEQCDGLEGKVLGHMDSVRRKDQELQNLRHDYEKLLRESEETEVSLKKKHKDIINEMNEQIDHITNQRNRSEADKKNLLVELGELSGNLEKIQAAKENLETKIGTYDLELRRTHSELEERTRQLQDLCKLKTKLTNENGELQSRLKILESNVDELSRNKQKNLREIENLKATIEENEAEKPHLISKNNSLQTELGELNASLEDERQKSHLLFVQVQKLQNDFSSYKNKAEKDLSVSAEENEALRKKYLSKIAELENGLNLVQKKLSKTDKENSKLVFEIKDLIDEIEKSKTESADLSKKLKQSDFLISELNHEIDQVGANFQQSQASVAELQTELAKIKSSFSDKEGKCESLLRELKLANDRTKEFKQQGDEIRLQAQDLQSSKLDLEREVSKLKSVINDLEKKLSESRENFESSTFLAKQTSDELIAELRLKDEEINDLKKAKQKVLEGHQHQLLEFEARHKSELSRTKKYLETEILQISTSLDSANKTQAELVRANKALTNRVKELENALVSEEHAREDLKSQLNSSERRRTADHAELDKTATKLDAAEHRRKMLELALHEKDEKLSELTLAIVAASNDARRHEAEADSLRLALEESNTAKREIEEKMERFRLELDGVNEALNVQVELSQGKDSAIRQLQKDLEEANTALEEAEQNTLREEKILLGKVQTRCKGLESDLESVQKKCREAQAENRRINRLLHELVAAKDSDAKELADKANQLESTQASLARLKKQLLEAEEVIAVVTSKYRRLQNQFHEVSDQQQSANAGFVALERSLPTSNYFLPGFITPVAGSARVSISHSSSSMTKIV